MRFKLILLGNPKVGKTTIRRSFMGDSLEKNYIKTIGVDFSIYKNEKGAFQIWDIAGEAGSHTFENYVFGASGAILLFDVMEIDTLQECMSWINRLYEALNEEIPLAIVGNKIDLRSQDTGISDDQIEQVYKKLKEAAKTDKMAYFETSALLNENVDDVFNWIFNILNQET